MKTRYIIVFLVMMMCLCTDMYSQTQVETSFENEIVEKNKGLSTIVCSFTQTRSMSVLSNEVSKDGKFYFVRPDRMLLLFDDSSYIKMTGKWFEMNTAGNIVRTKVSSNPMLKNLSSILTACVMGDFAEMKKSFVLDIRQAADEWIVSMKPKGNRSAVKISEILIEFDRDNMSLNSLEMKEGAGDSTKYKFFGKRFNVNVDDGLFEIK